MDVRRAITTPALLLCAALLAACAAEPDRPPAADPPPAYALLPAALAAPGRASVAGYVVVDTDGARLVDALLPAGPAPAAPADEQVWLQDPAALDQALLQSAGALRYAPAVVSGRLEGPGAYGPGGAHRYQIVGAQVEVLTPLETSIAALLDRPGDYAGRLVRVNAALLARDGANLLVERVGPGGIPAPGSRQIKLAGTLRPQALPAELQRSPAGDVRFGAVQVEGLWVDGALVPLMVLPVTR